MASQLPFEGELQFVYHGLNVPTSPQSIIRPRYSSTPWSERPSPSPTPPEFDDPLQLASQAYYALELASQASLPPQPASQTLVPLIPSIEEPSEQTDIDKIPALVWWKSESHRTSLLRVCLEKKHLYGRIVNKVFWEGVAQRYHEISGYPIHQTLNRRVAKWVQSRKDF